MWARIVFKEFLVSSRCYATTSTPFVRCGVNYTHIFLPFLIRTCFGPENYFGSLDYCTPAFDKKTDIKSSTNQCFYSSGCYLQNDGRMRLKCLPTDKEICLKSSHRQFSATAITVLNFRLQKMHILELRFGEACLKSPRRKPFKRQYDQDRGHEGIFQA